MSPSELFAFLGAPLANVRWSWGSVREDGTVFLRIWQDGVSRINGRTYAHVSTLRDDDGAEDSLGYKERLAHAELIRKGARCYFIMCVAVDPDAVPRKIKSFNKREVFRGGSILEKGPSLYVELLGRVPVTAVRQRADA